MIISRLLFAAGIVISCSVMHVFAQVPQAFNYQAVARDAGGNPLAGYDVSIRISLLPESETASAVYSEVHQTTTNQMGIINIPIGEGTNKSGELRAIDWGASAFYMKVEMDPAGGTDYIDMGVSKLLSVPYALHAASADGIITGEGSAGNIAYWIDGESLGYMPYIVYGEDESVKISSKDDAGDDDPIFEVKNRDGQVVFGVYQTGVRIYVEDDITKGPRAGFAVGGFTRSKEDEQEIEYLRVDPYSVRITIEDLTEEEEQIKGPRAGFAVGGFTRSKQEEVEFLRVDPGYVRINIDDDKQSDLEGNDDSKGARAGFAVGGFTRSKQTDLDYFSLSPSNAEFWLKENDESKGTRAGFAVGGFTPGKTIPASYLDLTPENYFIGHQSGSQNTEGLYNSFLGYQSGKYNTRGNSNIFIGYQSGMSNTVGMYNTFMGYQAGYSNIGVEHPGVPQMGRYNCYFGYQAGYASQYGDFNTMIGYRAGMNNTASLNTFIGFSTGEANTEGAYNTFIGVASGIQNATGSGNVFMGHQSGFSNIEGEDNIFIGSTSGAFFKSGNGNVVLGRGAGSGSVYSGQGEGSYNVVIGNDAGKYAFNGSSNIFIGNKAGMNETGSNLLYIDNSGSETPLVWGDFENSIFRINGNIQYTGTIGNPSDARLKHNMTQVTGITGKLEQISVIYFDYLHDPAISMLLPEGRQIGIAAQDIERVYPELVITGDNGYKLVDYVKLTPLLLGAIKEQQQQIKDQSQQLREHREQINYLLNHQVEIQIQALTEQQDHFRALQKENELLREQIVQIMIMLSTAKSE